MARDFNSYSILRTIVLVPPTPLSPELLRSLVSTMAAAGSSALPYHHPYLGDAQTKGIDVIPTSGAIIPVLGLGVAQVSAPISMYIRHRIYRYFFDACPGDMKCRC